MTLPGLDRIAAASRLWVLMSTGACLSAIALIVLLTPFGQGLERNYGLGLLFLARGALTPPASVSIVSINDSAAQAIRLPADHAAYQTCGDISVGPRPAQFRPLPSASRLADWPRCVHARLVERLAGLGADSIVFDVTFRERDPYMVAGRDVRSAQDERLAEAMRRAQNVFLTTKVHDQMEVKGRESARGGASAATLTPIIRQEALGVGPIHIADVAPPYGRTFLFSMADTPRPSVLIQVLMYRLRSAYPDIVSRFPHAGLPPSVAELLHPGELEATALQLRQLLRAAGSAVGGTASESIHSPTDDARTARWHAALAAQSTAQINLYGPAGTIDTLAYDEVLGAEAGSPLADKIRGRTVFVGYMETQRPEQVDHFESYYGRPDGVHYSGVELAATVFANLLDGTLLQRPSDGMAGIIVVLFAFMPMALVLLRPQIGSYIAAGATGAAYLAFAVLLFGSRQMWLPIVLPLALLAAGLLIAAGWQSLVQRRHSNEIEKLLDRLLPPEVVSRMRKQSQRLQSPNIATEGACVATDVEGYTQIAEKLRPSDLARLMDRYFSPLVREIARHGGVVSNIAGDEVIGIWAGESEQDERRSACEVVLVMRDEVGKFNLAHPQTPLPTRFGVHFGPLTFGSLEGQAPLGAFGDVINTASRIQDLSKTLRTRVLISGAVLPASGEFVVRDVGSFVFHNKTIPQRVYELLGHTGAVTPHVQELCAQFTSALAACRAGNMDEGRRALLALQQKFPDDGPVTFYVQYLARHPDWNGGDIALE